MERSTRLVWINEARIYFNFASVRRVAPNPLMYVLSARDDATFQDAERLVDQYAQTRHVTVFVERRRLKRAYELVGVSSRGRESATSRGYSFIAEGGRTLAHEWGHTLNLLDNEQGTDPRFMMTQTSSGGAAIVVVVLLTSNPKMMGDRTNPALLRWLGWVTAGVMTAAAAAMFWTWNS